MRRLSLSLFGGFEARIPPGPRLSFQTRKAQALLAYLALPLGRAHPRDKLAALLWGDRGDEQARRSVRQALYDIRKALGVAAPAVLRAEHDTVALSPAAVDLDVLTFTRLIDQGTPDALEQAAALYQGDLLAGLNVSEESLETWLMHEREHLHEMAMQALAKLLSHQSASGASEAAIRTAHQLLALDPLQEAVHRTLMRIYIRHGRRAAALRQYQHCVNVLQRDLGIEPELETKLLYQQILRNNETVSGAVSASAAIGASEQLVRNRAEIRPSDAVLVGRDADMARFRDPVQQAAEGRGRLFAILGEAGIGKSRLVDELIANVTGRAWRVLIGRAYESDQVLPFGPWVDALRVSQIDRQREIVEGIGDVWRAELSRLLPEVAAPGATPLSAQADYRQLFESVAQVVQRIARSEPLLVVLEDLHWADEMTVRLLAFVSRRIHTERVLLVVTAREEELEDAPLLRRTLEDLTQAGHLVPLHLAPLSQPDTNALVRLLARKANVERLEEQAWASSEGNPFVVVETVRALHDGATAPGMALPQRVHDVIRRRLDRLGDNARSLLTVAGVVGRTFEFQLLRRASGLEEDMTAEGVEELVRRRVLTSIGERLDFTHERIREVVYSQLSLWRRKRLHYRVAQAIEGLYADNLEPHYEALGTHYRDAEAWEKAARYLHTAGNKAALRSAYRQAIGWLEEALAAVSHFPEGQEKLEQAISIRIDLAPALIATSSFSASEVGATYVQAYELCQRLGETSKLFPVLWGLARFHSSREELPAAQELGERLVGLAQRTGDPALILEAHHTQMATLFSLGELADAHGHAAHGIELYDPHDHRGHASLYGNHDPGVCFMTHAAWALWLLGYPDRALHSSGDALTLARTLAHPYTLAHALYFAAWVHVQRGETHPARTLADELMALATEHDWPRWITFGTALLGHALVVKGHEVERGIADIQLGVDAREWRDHFHFAALFAEACGNAGHVARGLAVLNEKLARAHQTGTRYYEAELHRLAGELRLKSGIAAEEDDAERDFHMAIEVARQQMAKSLELRAVMSLTRLWQSQGKRSDAALAEAYRQFTEGFTTTDLQQAKLLLEHC